MLSHYASIVVRSGFFEKDNLLSDSHFGLGQCDGVDRWLRILDCRVAAIDV